MAMLSEERKAILRNNAGGIICQCGNPIVIDRINDYWLDVIERELGRKVGQVRGEIGNWYTGLVRVMPNGNLPFVVFGGKADENEKITIYHQAIKDILSLPSLGAEGLSETNKNKK